MTCGKPVGFYTCTRQEGHQGPCTRFGDEGIELVKDFIDYVQRLKPKGRLS